MMKGEGIINALPQCVYLISVSASMFTIRLFCSSINCGYNFPIAGEGHHNRFHSCNHDEIIFKLIALICLLCMQTSDKDKLKDHGCSILIDATTPFFNLEKIARRIQS